MERNVRISFWRASGAATWSPFAARAVIWGVMLFPALALAGEAYVGVAAGYSFAHFHTTDIVNNGIHTPLDGSISGESYRLFVGYSFCPYVALESGWFESDNLSRTVGGFPISSTQTFDGGQHKVKVRGVSLDVVGTLPISGNFSGFARAGVLASRVENDSWYSATVTYPGGTPFEWSIFPIPRRANRFEFALGAQYKVSSRWSFKSDWQRVDMSAFRMGHLDTLEVAAVYAF